MRLPRSTPEAQGVSSRHLLDLVVEAEATPGIEVHSVMVARHGSVVAEGWWAPYAPDLTHHLFSASKTLTATAVGLAQAEGLLSVDDRIVDHFPELTPAHPSPNLARMRVRHLLTMSTGQEADPSEVVFAAPDHVRAFLAVPVPHEPGTRFVYSDAASYVLSALVQRVTGQRLLDYLTPRVLAPLGITGATWARSVDGVDLGGWGLCLTTEDLACVGQLLLDDGVWRGVRLLPEGWVAEASARHVSNGDDPGSDWAQGYGYQLWRCTHGGFRADGAFGQLCVVLPEQGMVVTITSAVDSIPTLLSLVWRHVLAGLGDGPLPDDAAAHGALVEHLATRRLDPPSVDPPSGPVAEAVLGRTLTFEPNDVGLVSMRLDAAAPADATEGEHDVVTFVGAPGTLAGAVVTSTVRAGRGTWLPVRVEHPMLVTHDFLLSGGWVASDRYRLTLRELRGPTVLTVDAQVSVEDDGSVRVAVDRTTNVAFGPTTLPPLVARARAAQTTPAGPSASSEPTRSAAP